MNETNQRVTELLNRFFLQMSEEAAKGLMSCLEPALI